MSFSVTPAQGFAPPTDEGFPQFIQWQDEGTNLGGPDADTVNFTGTGVTVTRGTGENENKITVDIDNGGAPALTWRVVAGDGTVTEDDLDNGIRMTAATGGPVLHVDDGVIGEGQSVLVAVTGNVTSVHIIGTATLVYPVARFQAKVNGKGGVGTLIGLEDGSVLLCGDLLAV